MLIQFVPRDHDRCSNATLVSDNKLQITIKMKYFYRTGTVKFYVL